ncbi:cell division protein FtsZ [Betaproteobacteria bacterium]|nr:cell division protein FtsZ [Betaproteobacteria bacterium]
MAMFEIIEKEDVINDFETVIKVIGVGGAGGNAVDHMIREGVMGVEFIAANTDAQALKRSVAHKKLRLGKTGLGAGAKPEVGRDAAISEREQIAAALKGAHMVFITAGMGGGTGTGAAPVVAEIAREMGVLTVAVVTKPFAFEGKRGKVAEAGITELQKHVDSLIVVLNDRLMDVLGDDISMEDAFNAANNVLSNAVGGIAEIINYPGLVNVDFEDVKTAMSETGMAMMGSASATGVDRARIAAEQAVASPLLEGVNLSGARGVLVNITASHSSLKLKEVHEVMNTVREFAADDAYIIFGAVYAEGVEDDLRVTVVATGLGQHQTKRQPFEVINTPVVQATGTDGGFVNGGSFDPKDLDVPAVVRKGRNASVEAMTHGGVDRYEIPAFLRKQAD